MVNEKVMANEIEDCEVLAEIQHNGGKTNLIDFTTDYLVALFFACDSKPSESGRVILLSESGEGYYGEGYYIDRPANPTHRVIAQKSVFVRPKKDTSNRTIQYLSQIT